MSVTDQTIQQLKASIVSGEFVPGQRLPTERDLAARLGVSRNTLREAIRALTLGGILEARQGDGTYVTSLAPGQLLDSFALLIEMSQDATVLDMLAVRRVLEAEAASRAAARITEEQLAELAGCLDAMRHDPQAGEGTVDEVVSADARFHEVIMLAAANPVAGALVQSLSGRTLRARVWRGHADQGVFPRAVGEHEAIYEAVRDRDPARAAAAMSTHIAAVESFLRGAKSD
ncbi:FadR family transcriptional regulator [Nonomuraea sp. NBC_01738]|uniref:FadR/GntR family transcriptional regulator n=1 Tax=Nonomuraea sp. NBC_01738 TaxID=2976003 RepID=UPI002E111FE2|nr:FadR family transcriptional regulator [Nonomuraea sp. NBC_01738]